MYSDSSFRQLLFTRIKTLGQKTVAIQSYRRRTLGVAKRGIILAAVALTTLLTTACPPKQVVAKCTDKSNDTSVDFGPSRVGTTSIGILNTHHFGPGDVIELIPPAPGATLGTGSRVDTLTFAPSDFLADDPPTTTSQVIATDFELSVDATLTAFTAQIQAALQHNTQLTLTGGSRHAFAHPLDILAASSNASLNDRILQHPDRSYVVVTGIVNGTDLSLQYQDKNSGSANVNIMKLPGTKVTISVTYNCSNIAELKATGQSSAGLAFFYTTVAAVSGKVDTVATADLTKYSLPNAGIPPGRH